jgi:poly(3-hydroxybutyrate) depolymerase
MEKGILLGVAAVVLGFTTASAITYPPASSFLYGNSAVNQKGQTTYVSGSGLDYRYLEPKNYNPALRYTVVIFLHGSGERVQDDDGNWNEVQLKNNANGSMALVSTSAPDNQTLYPCIFVAPQTRGDWGNKAPQIQAILETLATWYSIDPDRICLTGLSLGALGSWSIVAALPDTFASLVPLAGGGTSTSATLPKIPLWVFHAENDPTVVCNGSDTTVNNLRNRSFPVLFTRYTLGAHGIWHVAYRHPQLMPWISAQRRGQPMQGTPTLAITESSLALSPLKLKGTAENPGLAITRVGWTNSRTTGTPGGSDGVTDGTTTFTSAGTTFNASHVGYRIAITKTVSSNSSRFIYDIVAVIDAHTITLDRTSSAETNRPFNLYKPGVSTNINPAAGTSLDNWQTWSVDVPMGTGANLTQVIMEMATGSTSFGGRTSFNQPLSTTYAAPLGDMIPPEIVVAALDMFPLSVRSDAISLAGTASDNVGVTEVSWSTDHGAAGIATGTLTWEITGVPLEDGPNFITIAAKDANGNRATRTIAVFYDVGASTYPEWKNTHFAALASDPVIAGDLADPERDGIGNLLEYALGGNPHAPSASILPELAAPAEGLRISFTRLAPTDVTYVVQASTDLMTWTPIATLAAGSNAWTGTATVQETGMGGTRDATVSDTAAISLGTRRYLRLQVTPP